MSDPGDFQRNEIGSLQYQDIAVQLSSLLASLSHPARVQILLHLSEHKNCPAGNISDRLPLCKSTVSQHLSKLKETGLITCSQEGLCQNYMIHDANISRIKTLFLDFYQQIEVMKERRKKCPMDANELLT